ncbi:dTDP-4-dehydrorhamnose 3,5-epimerase [Shewanella corallii]|uniref:dTDP-4-dehydrorhamnose 3,5-epimerase n=1 Tax=Shewanella corallii TaxID=560080 RepID=A0ABT0N410_9GAMM|nr:dTDP-4-dehydrorhamnose 3,5-epimerase [Shewanella corallii]MCL2913174.1 dTDP-4-dehydrorhamnose 3,5-epimerase [Shewanella corallii]
MKVKETSLPGVLLFEPQVFGDSRGFFMETFRQADFDKALLEYGQNPVTFVQDNHSRSCQHVLRGMHYQEMYPQGKLIRVLRGQIFDVAIDIRDGSETYGRWFGQHLSEENKLQMWVPPGFAHGFYVLSDIAEVAYRCTEYYMPESERIVAWNCPKLAINWPLGGEPLLSEKDMLAQGLA